MPEPLDDGDIPPIVGDVAEETFLDPTEATERLRQACSEHPDAAEFREIGTSEMGRSIHGVVIGRGEVAVRLIAGNHSDEPVGPEFLRRLVPALLLEKDAAASVLQRYRFFVVPHVNPDGEARNAAWRDRWPDFGAYVAESFREPPGRDVEFGYPDMRPENAAVAQWLRVNGPFQLHASLHGMGISAGALLLIERHWGYRTKRLQAGFREAVRAEGLPFLDQNRQGEKGFFYLGPGLWTTPEGSAMRSFFRGQGDAETAGLFRSSSMELVRSLGGDPLCYVTELPLFLVEADPDTSSLDEMTYLDLKARLPELRMRISRGESIAATVERFGVRSLDLAIALRLQVRTLAAALAQIGQVDREQRSV